MKTKEEIENICGNIVDSESINDQHKQSVYEGCVLGYTQCQEDMAEKKHKCYHPLPYRLAKSDVNYECTLCGKFI
jgi:hypothetical protein